MISSLVFADHIAVIKRHIPFVKDKPLLLGKLRVRLSTMLPGNSYAVALPMLAGRRNGGERTCTAHLTMQVRSSRAVHADWLWAFHWLHESARLAAPRLAHNSTFAGGLNTMYITV